MNKKPKPVIELSEQRLSHLDADDFATALRHSQNGGPVVTMLMPMERRGAETRKNHIVFKNLLREAREAVEASAPGGEEQINARLTALESLDAPTHGFWQNQDEGLAMVVEPGGRVTAYKVPFPLDPYVRVDRHPYLSPLLRLAGGRTYHVLAIDLDELKLYRASAWDLEQIELKDLPTSLDEAMKYDDPEDSLQIRGHIQQVAPAGGGGGGRPLPAYHGHGVTNEDVRNIKIRRFFEMVDKKLAAHFDSREMPLALMGPPDFIGFYRNVNRYPHLLDQVISTNPSALTRDQMREYICAWVHERDTENRRKGFGTLEDNIGIGEGSVDFDEVVKAAFDGRISTLFVKAGEYRYGCVDREADQVVVRDEPENGDEELVESAVLAAAEGGATIHFLEGGEELPGGACLGAIFRYSLTSGNPVGSR